MALSDAQKKEMALILDHAACDATTVPMLTAAAPELSIDEAYDVQRLLGGCRLERGDRLVGMKMGLTSEAKMKQMGVHEPICGHLTSGMQLSSGGDLNLSALGHPRVEPEVAFILGRDLQGSVTPQEALEAVDGVCAALEIIDSRYANFKFTLNDVVADNASSAHFVLGDIKKKPNEIDLGGLTLRLAIDGEVVAEGLSSAIYGHPARSLAAQAALLAPRGEGLKAGQIVLAGGATAAVAIEPGQKISVEVQGLGGASFSTSG